VWLGFGNVELAVPSPKFQFQEFIVLPHEAVDVLVKLTGVLIQVEAVELKFAVEKARVKVRVAVSAQGVPVCAIRVTV
jgi:hypothetical protein